MKKFKELLEDIALGIACIVPFITMFFMWLVMGY